MSAAPIFAFAGQPFQMLADRALFWPRHGALIVADLHLEKASWYAALGQPLPPYDSHDTLDRLAALAAETGARAVWCLGDSFHDRHAAERIAPAVAARLLGQAASTKLLWIAGNHDGLSGGAWGGEVADELCVDGIVLRHQSLGTETRPEISGHFHPKLRLNIRGRPVSRACFAGDEQRLILPAFGSLTGGLAVGDPVIAANFAGPYDAMLVAGGRRLCFPCPGRVRRDATASRKIWPTEA
ncbi:MAG: ligase-associated DNA damage response endonuclease PdeM [Sphingopyxis sp.]|nr:ligase-associated DNA damage response endonuclease PdeM [Sphingopyxis sp.]